MSIFSDFWQTVAWTSSLGKIENMFPVKTRVLSEFGNELIQLTIF